MLWNVFSISEKSSHPLRRKYLYGKIRKSLIPVFYHKERRTIFINHWDPRAVTRIRAVTSSPCALGDWSFWRPPPSLRGIGGALCPPTLTMYTTFIHVLIIHSVETLSIVLMLGDASFCCSFSHRGEDFVRTAEETPALARTCSHRNFQICTWSKLQYFLKVFFFLHPI